MPARSDHTGTSAATEASGARSARQAVEWHAIEAAEALRKLESEPHQGLTEEEAGRRRAEHGPNELVEREGKSPWLMLWEELTATMVLILIAAAAVSGLLGDYKDAGVIAAIVVINALLGFSQEYRAEKAVAALKRLAVPMVRARRGGTVREIQARELVPGDIVLLEAGGLVPADCRLLESNSLRAQESVLTGESEPVEKVVEPLPTDTGVDIPIPDRLNMVYMGTVVTYGRGLGVITATGMETELGRIASMIQVVRREATPLQRRLDQLGKWLVLAALAVVAAIFVLGLLRGEEAHLMFLTAVSIAVAAVPEGLPAVVTVALALGAQRMLKRNALIRKLPAVETLGSVTAICSDKTGTLTENRMTVVVLDVAGDHLDLTENQSGEQEWQEWQQQVSERPSLALLVAASALCSDAELRPEPGGEEPGAMRAIGDPTEGALVVAAARLGLSKTALEELLPRKAEIPFDSHRKRMTTLHELALSPGENTTGARMLKPLRVLITIHDGRNNGRHHTASAHEAESPTPYVAFTKGAIDSLLGISTRVWVGDGAVTLTDDWRLRIVEAHDRLAGSGRRVLGVAVRPVDSLAECGIRSVGGRVEVAAPDCMECDLIFLGLVGMVDPPRPEVKEAVRICKEAGVHVFMLTGDHPLTAEYIAQQLGITGIASAVPGADIGAHESPRTIGNVALAQTSTRGPEGTEGSGSTGRSTAINAGAGGRLATGQDLSNLTADDLSGVVEQVPVYARISPEHKLRIVEALQNHGQIVAMTGDGVNDAPALRKADIGVAMGVTGTDVCKETADMVLLDDNFATIVAAVREGRAIYDNIRKFIRYILTGNSGELWVMLLAPLIGMPLPLLPLQILWVNLVTDGLPALALGVEPAEQDVMRRSPYPPSESILSRGMGWQILGNGLLVGLVSLGAGYWYWRSAQPEWQTMTFTVLTFAQLALALAFRSERYSLFRIGLFSNMLLLAAVALTFILQLAVVYLPFLQDLFDSVPLSPLELALCLLLGLAVFISVEMEKWLMRRARVRQAQ